MLLYTGESVQLNPVAGLQVTGAILFGVIAYYSLTIAMRSGEVSVVSPFRYVRLLFAIVIGLLVFGETPDMATILGSLLIVLSGGYTLIRSRRQRAVPSKPDRK